MGIISHNLETNQENKGVFTLKLIIIRNIKKKMENLRDIL